MTPFADQLRCELRTHLAGMAVTQLMKRAAVLIEDPVVGMDQVEERIAAKEPVPSRTALLGIETSQPACSIGIVINCERVSGRNHGPEH